jgi:ABC-type molybdate transport system substrate-binding protein
MMNRSIISSFAAFGLASAVLVATAQSPEIKIVSTGAFKEVLGELAPAYQRSSGHKLTVALPEPTRS